MWYYHMTVIFIQYDTFAGLIPWIYRYKEINSSLSSNSNSLLAFKDVIMDRVKNVATLSRVAECMLTRKIFPYYWPKVRGLFYQTVSDMDLWSLVFFLSAWTSCWANSWDAVLMLCKNAVLCHCITWTIKSEYHEHGTHMTDCSWHNAP